VAPAQSANFDDDVRVMYCVGADCLKTSFRRLMGGSVPSALSVEQNAPCVFHRMLKRRVFESG
jgi:hypothetical protein